MGFYLFSGEERRSDVKQCAKEALEEQVELFEATVQNAEKKCDEIDARIAQLHV